MAIAADQIKDRETLKEWLQSRPREDAVAIAHRAAMRVFPLYGAEMEAEWARVRNLTELPILRCHLISAVAALVPTVDIRPIAASDAAISAADFASDGRAFATTITARAFAASSAARAATSTVIATAVSDVFATTTSATATARAVAARAARAVDFATNAHNVWATVRSDAALLEQGETPLSHPLWPDQTPEDFAHAEREMLRIWRAAPDNAWDFWQRWWDGAKKGRYPNPQLLLEIAKIDDEDLWKYPAALAERIAEIELEFAVQATPNAEEVVFDDAAQLFRVAPRSDLPARNLQDALARMMDVARYIREQATGNQYTALLPEADFLEDAVARYSQVPLRLQETCDKAIAHVLQAQASGELPENDRLVSDVLMDMQNTADDIVGFDPYVNEVVERRAALRIERFGGEQREKVVALANAAAKVSEPQLAQELREDAAEVAQGNDAETKVNRYRLGSRLTRIVVITTLAVDRLTAFLASVEPAWKTVQALWQIIRPLLGL